MIENREKIIQMLGNPLVSEYGIEKMSNGRLYSANYQRYKKRVEKENKPMVIFDRYNVGKSRKTIIRVGRRSIVSAA